jgi:hypothetical protein
LRAWGSPKTFEDGQHAAPIVFGERPGHARLLTGGISAGAAT